MKYLYLIIAVLAVAIVGLNHYVVNYELSRILNVDNVQLQQFVANKYADDAAILAYGVQYVCTNQSDEIVTLNRRLDQTVNLTISLKSELEQAKIVVESDGEIIQELTDENSDLQTECDGLYSSLVRAVEDYQKLQNEYDALKVEYDAIVNNSTP